MSCFTACIWLEENAKKQLWASLLGPPRAFSEEECERVLPQMWKESVVRKTWDYYVERGRALGRRAVGLADERGQVLVSVDPAAPVGSILTKEQLDGGTPVMVNGRQVGTIITGHFPPNFNAEENLFLKRTTDALVLAARVALRRNAPAEARTRLQAALALGADYPDVHLLIGDAWRQERNWKPARQSYERALDLNAHLTAARSALALLPPAMDGRCRDELST